MEEAIKSGVDYFPFTSTGYSLPTGQKMKKENKPTISSI